MSDHMLKPDVSIYNVSGCYVNSYRFILFSKNIYSLVLIYLTMNNVFGSRYFMSFPAVLVLGLDVEVGLGFTYYSCVLINNLVKSTQIWFNDTNVTL